MRSPRSQKTRVRGECADSTGHVEELYEQYASRVAAYALRRTNRADAADVVAETFLVAWRRREQIPNEPMALPWLYGVARRVLANQMRANQRRTRLHDRLVMQFTHHHSPTFRVEAAEGFERVAVALGKLSADDAEVLRLTAWECLSPSEIASVMDLEPQAVRQRIHRARKRLRKHLSADEPYFRRPTARSPMRVSSTHNPIAALIWDLSEEGW